MQTQKRNGHQLNAKAIKQSQKRNRPLNASGIKQTQKRNRLLNANVIKQTQKKKRSAKGNVIGRVLNVLAWQKRVRYGKAKRSTDVPCKTNEAIEKELPTKLFKGM